MRFLSAVVLVLLSFGLVLPASAQTSESADAVSNVRATTFGHVLAMSGETLFVGDPSSVHGPGRVLVYTRTDDGWTESSVLQAGDAAVGDGFGGALAADGDRVAIGAPATNAVYLFEKQGDQWMQTERLSPETSGNGQFGGAVALHGSTLVASIGDPPFSFRPSIGSVVVFEADGDGWTETQTLVAEDAARGDNFGVSLAVADGHLLVGAPNTASRAGAVYVFGRDDAGVWTEMQTLTGASGTFGATLVSDGTSVAVGVPSFNGRRGAVQVATRSDGQWDVTDTVQAFDAPADALFGSAVAFGADGRLWVGAPRAGDGAGALYGFVHDGSTWTQATRHTHPETGAGDRLGNAVAASGSHVAAGQPEEDYGARMYGGSVVVVYDAATGAWMDAPLSPPSRDIFQAMTGEKKPCADGTVSQFTCEGVDLLSFLPIQDIGGKRGVRVNDVWGWTDPETGRDYALVGRVDGTSFVDVTDPMNPAYIGDLPKTEGSESKIWRDVKVYENHAYVVADNAGVHGMQVFALSKLRDVAPEDRPATFEADALYEGIHSAHNVFINEDSGFAYVVGSNGGGQTCGGGLHMVDIRDPLAPTFAGCFADTRTGRTGTGTTHDTQCVMYEGPDTEYQGREICFSSNETAVSIADVTDKANPVAISTAEHPVSAYIHQGWLTGDQRYFYVNDEGDEISGLVDRTRTIVWDLADLDDPQIVTEFFLPVPASDHNLYIRGTTMYQSNYTSGLRVIDISDPENPKEVGHFDTLPYGPDAPGFEGSFSNYPFFESGIVVVTSIKEGLFVVKKSETEL